MGSHRVGHDWSDLAAAAGIKYKAPMEIHLFRELVRVSVKAECSMIDTMASSLIYVFNGRLELPKQTFGPWLDPKMGAWCLYQEPTSWGSRHRTSVPRARGWKTCWRSCRERALTASRGTVQGFLEEVNRGGLREKGGLKAGEVRIVGTQSVPVMCVWGCLGVVFSMDVLKRCKGVCCVCEYVLCGGVVLSWGVPSFWEATEVLGQ